MKEMDKHALVTVLGQLGDEGRQCLRHLVANTVAPLAMTLELDDTALTAELATETSNKLMAILAGIDG